MASGNTSSIVSKSVLLLDILAASRRPLTFSEIAQKSGFVKSSAHRVLSVLVTEGLVELDETGKTYTLGPKLVIWARAAWRRTDIQQIAAGELEILCEQTGMNVALSIRDDDSVLYLRTIDTVPVRYAAHTGEHAPLHCTAVGKVYLAFMPNRQREELLPRLRFEKFTEFTIRDPELLIAELPKIRENGYATCFQEEFLQVHGVAVPIFNAHGDVCAGISLWALSDKHSTKDMLQKTTALRAAGERISFQMGYEAAE